MIAWAQKQLEIDYPSVGKVVVQSSPGFGLKKGLFEPKIGLKVGKNVTNFEKYCILGSFPQYYYLEDTLKNWFYIIMNDTNKN